MSFMSRLFRKPDQADKAEGDADPPADEARSEQAVPDAEILAAESPGADQDAPALDGPELPDAGSEAPWWEAAAEAGSPPADKHGTMPLDPQRLAHSPAAAPEPGTRPPASADTPQLGEYQSERGLACAALRDIGRVRAINQDSVFAMLTTLPREGHDISLAVCIVADGMGGHQGGEVASRLAISTVAQHVLAELVAPALADAPTEALQPLLINAVRAANQAIWEHAQSLGSDMGTTCTVALLLGRALYLGHVGDTRAYLATPTGMRLLTNDHSTVGRLIQVGQLGASEAREHPLRSQLYRTVGQQPEVLVDFIYEQVGDATHLLLASDGLWGLLDDDLMLEVLQRHRWPHDACSELIARANLAGGDDNISAVVVALPSSTQ